MGFLDALLGRSKAVQPNLDQLFALAGAAITLEASEGLKPTGQSGVCFKQATGEDFKQAEAELTQLLSLDDASPGAATTTAKTSIAESDDEFGYHWIVLQAEDFDTLVTRTHIVNSTLQDHGYGPQLLCSVFGFGPAGLGSSAKVYLVYLYKRGTFYPFVPIGPERRDNEEELRLKVELASDLAIEPDLDRWFPLWKLPLR